MNEHTYLAIIEAPCVGTVAVTFTATCDAAADDEAYRMSAENPEYVTGGYDLYRIEYMPAAHTHKLVPVEGGFYCPFLQQNVKKEGTTCE